LWRSLFKGLAPFTSVVSPRCDNTPCVGAPPVVGGGIPPGVSPVSPVVCPQPIPTYFLNFRVFRGPPFWGFYPKRFRCLRPFCQRVFFTPPFFSFLKPAGFFPRGQGPRWGFLPKSLWPNFWWPFRPIFPNLPGNPRVLNLRPSRSGVQSPQDFWFQPSQPCNRVLEGRKPPEKQGQSQAGLLFPGPLGSPKLQNPPSTTSTINSVLADLQLVVGVLFRVLETARPIQWRT